MELTTKEWLTLVGIPLAVSLAANVLTPAVQHLLKASGHLALRKTSAASYKLIEVRIKQIDTEIAEIERLRDTPRELIQLLEGSVIFCQLSLCALLLSPLVAYLVSKLSPYLPWFYSNPLFAGTSVIAAIAAAGPMQAAIYASVVQHKLKKVRQSENRLAKLRAEKDQALSMLQPAKQAEGSTPAPSN